jgi:hypothetical protein
MDTIIAQLRAWADSLERGHDLGIVPAMRDIAGELEEQGLLSVPDFPGSQPCGLTDDETSLIIDAPNLVFATDSEDSGRLDPETGAVWVPVWYRVRGAKEEDPNCPHGMWYSGAGACPQCGGGAEPEPLESWRVEWRTAELPFGQWDRKFHTRSEARALRVARRVIAERERAGTLTGLALRILRGNTTVYTESSMPEEAKDGE